MEDSSSKTEFNKISEKNFKKMSSSVSKIGYIDGVTSGKDFAFQLGFDQGYFDGLRTGIEITKWRTLFQNSQKRNDEKLKMLLDKPATDKSHFQMTNNMEKPIGEISKLQNEYVDTIIKEAQK